MKELLEEFGGVITACFLGLLLLGTLSSLLDMNGGINILIQSFLEGIGAIRFL